MAETFRILILGATGVFGAIISRRLAHTPGLHLILASRTTAKIAALIADCRAAGAAASLEARPTILPDGISAALADMAGGLVIDATGPFQGADYAIAEAAIAAGAHYLDIADAREFVCGFDTLDAAAKEA
jgi:short subunit dehydrogenase-like uncharacterized protein